MEFIQRGSEEIIEVGTDKSANFRGSEEIVEVETGGTNGSGGKFLVASQIEGPVA